MRRGLGPRLVLCKTSLKTNWHPANCNTPLKPIYVLGKRFVDDDAVHTFLHTYRKNDDDDGAHIHISFTKCRKNASTITEKSTWKKA